ncbi:MAG: glycosyltransferase family 39 protein [Planctomycetes bacterium]|nr:glycosyltransferase family 39 protein [Planctomycetota bacterium]
MNPSIANSKNAMQKQTAMFVGMFLLALLMRGAFGAASVRERSHDHGEIPSSLHYDDERWYWSIAQSYRAGDGMVGEFGHRAERMPLYPWVLSWFGSGESGVSLARWFQYVLGALAACATFALARRFCEWGWAAGLIIALDPSLVGSASLLLNEALAVPLLAGLWWIAWPLRNLQFASIKRWLGTIVAAILCVYAKESTLPMVILLLGYIVFARKDLTAIPGVVATILCIAVALLPWAYRNNQVVGEWIWLTSRGGISLYDGVQPSATGASDLGGIKIAPEVVNLDEASWNRHFKQESWKEIRRNPRRILGLSLTKLARTWSPVLNAAEYRSGWIRVVFAIWYIPLYVLVIVGVWSHRHRRRELLGLLIPALCVCLMHAIFVGSVRYRLIAMPTLAIIAAMGLQTAYGSFKSSRQTTGGDA